MKSICIGLLANMAGCALALSFPAAAAAQTETVLHSFAGGSDGNDPVAALTYKAGVLYGTTTGGGNTNADCVSGAGGCGTVFSVDLKTGVETVLYSFCSKTGCTDGDAPYAGVIDEKGTLYGTTYFGGLNCANSSPPGCGTVFSLDTTTKAETPVYSFCDEPECEDGSYPQGTLIYKRQALYGTTYLGGDTDCFDGNGCGTVFSLDPTTGHEQLHHSFTGDPDGQGPLAGLIEVNDVAYGTTQVGGTYDFGTVFAVDLKSGAETVVYSFCSQTDCADGEMPNDTLIDVNGTLYGTTYDGGAYGGGTVFSLDPTTGAETVLYSFCSQKNCTDGEITYGGVVDVNGTLYGTTAKGGANCQNSGGCGTVFSLDPTTKTETVLYSFCSQNNCTDGRGSYNGVIDEKGALYGTTAGGGAYGYGTVFSLTLD